MSVLERPNYLARMNNFKKAVLDLIKLDIAHLDRSDAIHYLYEIETEIARMRTKIQDEGRGF